MAPRRKRVLCIDCDTVALRIRTAVLRCGGFDAVGASSLTHARQHLRQRSFHAVVMDENVIERTSGGVDAISDQLGLIPLLLLSSGNPWTEMTLSRSGRVRKFSKSDGPEAFLRAVRECVEQLSTARCAHGDQQTTRCEATYE